MERNEMINALEMIIANLTEKVAELNTLADTTEGKWINHSSNDLVLEGYDYYRDEEGHIKNRLGINGTGYTGKVEKALLFDTMEEAYNNGNFYLATIVNGKRKTIYVGAIEAAPFFRKKAESYKDTLELCKCRLIEVTAE